MTRTQKFYLSGLLCAVIAAAAGVLLASRKIEAPEQPIAFSHRVHAGANQIACVYCHTGVSASTFAGVPSVSTCYECHRLVKLKNAEIAKVMQHWDARQPIEWVRVHDLPDYVYFSHKRHVRAGVGCQNCHGEVQQMERVVRVAPLTMGWCLQCHEQRGAPRQCDTCHK
jgi:hypothetical protein